jgi:hypothetical protein
VEIWHRAFIVRGITEMRRKHKNISPSDKAVCGVSEMELSVILWPQDGGPVSGSLIGRVRLHWGPPLWGTQIMKDAE